MNGETSRVPLTAQSSWIAEVFKSEILRIHAAKLRQKASAVGLTPDLHRVWIHCVTSAAFKNHRRQQRNRDSCRDAVVLSETRAKNGEQSPVKTLPTDRRPCGVAKWLD